MKIEISEAVLIGNVHEFLRMQICEAHEAGPGDHSVS